ncbi:lanthionine synthetase LanC family protein [Halobaculum sp. MBLA0143]|uniref:lanthionine synthetase LanC family protein n=1 Tax=Halobaculum sp. MBLA0143 TaxID=3079933 RepID=UPI003525118B
MTEHTIDGPRDRPTTTLSDDRLRSAAEAIARQLPEPAIGYPDEIVQTVGYIEGENGVHPAAKPGVFCGRLGVAVYFAALAAVTETDSYTDSARAWADRCLQTDPETVCARPDIGVGSGVGSTVYGLTLLAGLTGEPVYADRASEVVQAIDRETVADDRQYDVLLGAAGTVHGLLAYYEASGDDTALETAHACGKHLLSERFEKWNGYSVWDTSRVDGVGSAAVGAAHGVGGIAHALYRLGAHTEDERYIKIAEEAVAFENTFYSPHERNWKANFGGVRDYTDWWCSGKTGVGATRLGSLSVHGSDTLRRDARRVAEALDSGLLAHDSLCHGNAGVLDLLVGLASHDETADLVSMERPRGLAHVVLERRSETGQYSITHGGITGLSNPVLFLGTTGVGYGFLRLLEPSLPSLVQFESTTVGGWP